MKRIMKDRFRIAVILLLILSMTFSFAYATRSQDEVDADIEEKQQELDEGKEKVEELEGEMSELQSEIDETQSNIDSVSSQIVDLQGQISDNQVKLENKKAELEVSVENLNQRLRNMYKNGSIGFIDVILSSENVTDLITNVELVGRIYASDKNLVSTLEKEYAEIEEIQTALESQKTELDGKMGELNSLQEQLSADYAKAEASKSEQEAINDQLEDDLADLEAESAEIAALIASQSSEQEYQGGGSGAFVWPVPGNYSISSEYAYRWCQYHGYELHSGIDIPASYGTSVVAADDGLVISAGWMGSYGNAVLISHGNGLYTLYGHNSSLNVSEGQTVSQGQTIAFVGSTGNSTGNHCHFEVRLGGSNYGNSVNPHNYL